MSCERCIEESRIHRSFTRRHLQNLNEHSTVSEDAMQFDLVPELLPSGGYENIVAARNVFPPIHLPTQHLTRTPKELLK